MLRRLAMFRAQLGSELGAAFDALAARLGLFRSDGEGYFSHPMALPVLKLPQWVAARAARQGVTLAPTTIVNLIEVAAVGYLHIRVQDDWFDEAVGEPGAVMMLSDALFARGQALLARETPYKSQFWELFEDVCFGYGEAMLLERSLQNNKEPYDAATFRQVLARSRPLVLPPAAALFAAGRAGDIETLEQFTASLVAAHQLFADLLDAEKDRVNKHRTYVLFRLSGRVDSSHGTPSLRAALFSRGGFDAIVSEALGELKQARRAASALAMPEATRFCEGRAQYMAGLQTKIFEKFFSGLLP